MRFDPTKILECRLDGDKEGPIKVPSVNGLAELTMGLAAFIALRDYQLPAEAQTWENMFALDKLQSKIKTEKPITLTMDEAELLMDCVLASVLPWQAKIHIKKISDEDREIKAA